MAHLALLLLLAAPSRIVSTAPSITEMLYALGLGERVVGVTTFCHYPPEVKNKPKIGTYLRPNIEAILALRPDLIVLPKNPAYRFTGLSVPQVVVDHEDVRGVYASIEQIGRATGTDARAKALVADLQAQLQAIGRNVAAKPKVSMLFIVGRSPDALDAIIAAGGASYLGELIETAGGRNVLGEIKTPYPRISHEEILSRDPEVIVDMGDMADTGNVTEAHRKSVEELWRKRYPNLRAVRAHRIFAVASDIYVVPGPRMVEAARAFARMLHPEAAR